MKRLLPLLMLSISSTTFSSTVEPEFNDLLYLLSKTGKSYGTVCDANRCSKISDSQREIVLRSSKTKATFSPLGHMYQFTLYPNVRTKSNINTYASNISEFLNKNGCKNRAYQRIIIGDNNLLIEVYSNGISVSDYSEAMLNLEKRLKEDKNLQITIPNLDFVPGLFKITPDERQSFFKRYNCERHDKYFTSGMKMCKNEYGQRFSIMISDYSSLVDYIALENIDSELEDKIKRYNKQFEWEDISKDSFEGHLKAKTTLLDNELGSISITRDGRAIFTPPNIFDRYGTVLHIIGDRKEELSKKIIKDSNGFLK